MVGISILEQGSVVADRYRVVERLTRFAVADSTLTGVEYGYWLALDETRGAEVWLQLAESRGVVATGADLAGVVSSLRRLNHPAVPAVLDFGEIEVEDGQDEGGSGGGEGDVVVASVGYVVLEPVDAASLATVLLRAALTEAEILAVLIEIADVLEVLHEVELVHGHLSAYSFLLGERSLLLVDLAAALALENAADSELTTAADVYALAWLACIALAGVEAVEAEFGVGYDAASSPESELAPQLLTLDLIERRRAWAELNLVDTYGVRAELAALLIAALGEASGRPSASALARALRAREDVEAAAVEIEAVEAEAVAEVEAAQAAAVVAGAEAVLAAAAAAEVEAETAEVEAEIAQGEVVEAGVVTEAEAVGIEEAEVVEVEESAGSLVGAGVGAAVAAEALGGVGSGSAHGGGVGGPSGVAVGLASVPVPPAGQQTGRHGSPPSRPRSAFYVAVAIVVLVVIAIVWGCSAGGSSPSASPSGSPTTAGQSSTSGAGGGAAGASPSATQSPAVSPSPSPSPVSSITVTAPGGGQAGGGTPGYTPTPLATAPGSPSQAVQQIQQTVSQARSAGQIPSQASGPLGSAIGTLQHEISSGSSVQPGISQLRGALRTPGIPSGFVSQINELIPYLAAGHGS